MKYQYTTRALDIPRHCRPSYLAVSGARPISDIDATRRGDVKLLRRRGRERSSRVRREVSYGYNRSYRVFFIQKTMCVKAANT